MKNLLLIACLLFICNIVSSAIYAPSQKRPVILKPFPDDPICNEVENFSMMCQVANCSEVEASYEKKPLDKNHFVNGILKYKLIISGEMCAFYIFDVRMGNAGRYDFNFGKTDVSQSVNLTVIPLSEL